MKFEKWAWTKRDSLLGIPPFYFLVNLQKLLLLDDVDLAENEKQN